MTFWTPEHARVMFPALAAALFLALILRLLLRRAPLWARLLPLQLIATAFLMLELQKQRCAMALQTGYDPYYLPFHFCSLFLLILPLAAFVWGKLGERLRAIAATLTCGVSVITFICPYEIIDHDAVLLLRSDFLAFHTVAFHLLIPLFFLLLVALDLYRPRRADLAAVLALTALYCVVGYRASLRFETNFSNLYYCYIDTFDEARTALAARIGEVAAQRRYTLVAASLHVAFAALSYALAWAVALLNKKRK